ncbi:hypothetical protein H6G80_21705 [Nostoc sp. FACHB-87]|uniref:hypothetical protein n=1 Tax=Nostocaceae TaxID=1162 RepID=UPI0016846E9B|nr:MULTISPECIES: hypothetical protein [Nostocaceae]MBD2456682.1 hypothetical protein [Nostoc sp. FACHB-87]MBD2478064.1 hypothetical protein [Anabaena sp. FACHB-83]
MQYLIKSFFLTTLICAVTTACNQNTTTTQKITNQCPNQPTIVLQSHNVKPIDFSTQQITQSGMVSTNKSLGFTFEAKSGQKLSYTTNQNLCIWIYSPDNQILTNRDLPLTGKYTIQVSTLQGSTTFDLALSLETVTAVSQPISSSTPSLPVSNNVDINSTAANTSYPTTTNNIGTNSTAVFKPIFSPTPTTSSANNVDRPSTEKVIEDYYTKVNSHQYQEAWNFLSTTLQEDRELHPDGYNSFIEWWEQVKYVSVNRYSLEDANNNGGVVNVWTRYYMKNGRNVSIPLKFYMSWNDANQKWEINKITTIKN